MGLEFVGVKEVEKNISIGKEEGESHFFVARLIRCQRCYILGRNKSIKLITNEYKNNN